MKHHLIIILFALLSLSTFSQNNISPYEWNWTTDGIWTGAALAGSAGGLLLIQNKEDISMEELNRVLANRDNINFLDKWVAGNDSEDASTLSDIPFALSFVAPFALLFDDEANEHSGQLFGIYIESLATTASLYAITAGLVNRSRPYVYSDAIPDERRTRNNGQRSFYSGHVAATTTATFFTAKVFQDFNPDSKGVPYVWTGAAILPLTVGYLRMEAGQHFLTDVLLGYGLGAVVGYYTPELHKKGNEQKLSFGTFTDMTPKGERYQCVGLSFKF